MKLIVIGPSLSGKTTLVRQLRSTHDLSVAEMDEKLTNLNNGLYPSDVKYKHEILAPKIIADVLNRDNIIFFTNTDYFSMEDLKVARDRGFKVILLSLSLDELLQRNKHRIEAEGYDDMSQWLKGMLDYQKQVQEQQLADQIIDANLPTEKIIEILLGE